MTALATGTDDLLLGAAAAFADDLTTRIRAVVETVDSMSALVRGEGAAARLVVGAIDPDSLAFRPIQLTINGKERLQLLVKYFCCWDSAKKYLAVDKSFFHVRLDERDTPLFRYEYVRQVDHIIPAAHLQVHAHRDEMIYLMTAANRGRPKARKRKVKVPRLAELHFPLGGHRFRPCVEDILEMLIFEFGIDTRPNFRQAIQQGREHWRRTQLRAAVRDDPEVAAEVLRGMNFTVSAPDGAMLPNRDKLIAF